MVHIVRFIKSQLEISRVDSFPIKEISLHTKARSDMISIYFNDTDRKYVTNTYDVGFPGLYFPIGTCVPVHGAAQVCKVAKILQPPEPLGSLMNGRNLSMEEHMIDMILGRVWKSDISVSSSPEHDQ